MTANAKILVATEVLADADLVKKLLRDEFGNVIVSTDGDRFVEDFEKHQPVVVIFALDTLEKTERYYLGLYRRSTIVHTVSYRTLILCNKEDLQRVYALCRKRYFDDYMLFWPMTHDTPRLQMAVHHALRDLSNAGAGAPLATKMAAQVRPLLELETGLDQYVTIGKQRIEAAARLLRQTQGEDCAALDSMRDWAATLKDTLAPQLKAATALRVTVEGIRPVVLIVDEDALQHKLLRQLLAHIAVDVTFATSGTEALATLAKRHADLIVMNVKLPDIDGIEVTRRLKQIERFAGIPVIMLTGQSEKTVVLDSMKAGASDFVVKPFDKDILLAKINKLLNIL